MTIICSTCGCSLAADIRFCPQCGTPTSSYSSEPTGLKPPWHIPSTEYGSNPYGVPLQNPYEPLNPYAVPLQAPPPPPPPHRVGSRLLIIISSIVISIVILGVVGTFALFTLRGRSNPVGSPSSSPAPTVPATLSQVPSQSCGGAFSDEFNGKLDSRWNWMNPSGNATYNVDNGFLSMTTPPNSDLNPGNNFNAPRLLHLISGDFTVETLVKFSPNATWQSTGILIWQDQTKFLRYELGYSSGIGITFEKDDNGLFSHVISFDQRVATGVPIALRVQKQGDHFTVSWHEPSQVWQIDGETDIHFDSLMVGLDLLATVNAPQTSAQYDYLRVSCM